MVHVNNTLVCSAGFFPSFLGRRYTTVCLTGTYISETTRAISFKFDMQGREYGPTKIYKFDRNRPNNFRATIG